MALTWLALREPDEAGAPLSRHDFAHAALYWYGERSEAVPRCGERSEPQDARGVRCAIAHPNGRARGTATDVGRVDEGEDRDDAQADLLIALATGSRRRTLGVFPSAP
jgi:hypothetical protein